MGRKAVGLFVLLSLACLLAQIQGASYIPQFIKGTPQEGNVVATAPPDLRGQPLFKIDHKVLNDEDGSSLLPGTVHRTYDEFKHLDELLRKDIWIKNPDVALPDEGASLSQMNDYLQALYRDSAVLKSNMFSDFLSINWDGSDVKFMLSLTDFMKMLFWDRLPEFMPEPPKIEKDDFLVPETPFERYVYFLAFRHPRGETKDYMKFFNSYVESTPSWDGPEDNSDVLHPALLKQGEFDYPQHYNFTYVHFLPGGYLNSQTVRISYLGKFAKFTFLDESKLNEWFSKLYIDVPEPIKPTQILDIGTGTGGSAFVLGELYPEAKVTALDLAPGYIRFCRQEKEIRNSSNVEFYQANCEDMSFIEDNSMDFINYAYVLHEMPEENAKQMVDEMYRVLKPGGQLNGFEIPYERDPVQRAFYSLFTDWGTDWHKGSADANQGPEPYMGEYEECNLPSYLQQVGFKNVKETKYSYFESIFTATK